MIVVKISGESFCDIYQPYHLPLPSFPRKDISELMLSPISIPRKEVTQWYVLLYTRRHLSWLTYVSCIAFFQPSRTCKYTKGSSRSSISAYLYSTLVYQRGGQQALTQDQVNTPHPSKGFRSTTWEIIRFNVLYFRVTCRNHQLTRCRSRPEGQESSSLTGTNGSGSSNYSGSRHESSQRM